MDTCSHRIGVKDTGSNEKSENQTQNASANEGMNEY